MIRALCILLLCCMCSCGTVANLAFGAPKTNNGFMGLETRVYGGIQWDFAVITAFAEEENPLLLLSLPLGIIDFPLSFVGDTFTLPIAIKFSQE
ncbi:YceK/YidQ family lipoprotein [Candidatus Uabimicrobium amorphum]|uniref:YceK/YidQ family lipoprotein n=1 Tax=Uabimicrobium amorphum TaxID=2596890 RepID=A0A5S9IR21_UABAM|nr:YceK/YidQ family lipoprotein [Candidatus Uabimicrobium amorphum]BBM86509.1 hypothetical protein UABAM_04895 [Candidatus Uabimicrobium amorphum]